jgi:Putative addiction module component
MVSLAEFKKQTAALPVEQRASLASFLLHSLPEPDYDVSDEEVAERLRQLKSGEVSTISMDELRAGVSSDRGR